MPHSPHADKYNTPIKTHINHSFLPNFIILFSSYCSFFSIIPKLALSCNYFFIILHKILHGGADTMKNENSINRIIQVNDINIGNSISKLRKALKIKQTDMVAKLQLTGIDISIYSYNRIEKGTQNPTVSFLYACCNIFDCDMNTLFNFK